jgi:hypothetical protein
MLVPAICYKEELLKKFSKEIYTDRYFLYAGYPHSHQLPVIDDSDDNYRWAIVDKDPESDDPSNLVPIGYLAYKVYSDTNSVENFGLYAFEDIPKSSCLGTDVRDKLIELINTYHRVSWRMIGGNPIQHSYDWVVKKYNGNIVQLHDVLKDSYGNYRDEFIYEIINPEK